MKPSAISATKAKLAKKLPGKLSSRLSTKLLRRPANPPDETLRLLKIYYPDAHCALNFRNPFELLVATVLSAQCTDERVNLVTPLLFEKYPTPEKMAEAPIEDLERLIRSTGFYKNKSKSLKNGAQALVRDHHGEVPKTSEELVKIPGVGRKTANVVLCNAFQIPSGVAVDTHVTRLTNRFDWVHTENAVQIEQILLKMFPVQEWIMLSHYLISHGRVICKARKPQCEKCFMETICAKRFT